MNPFRRKRRIPPISEDMWAIMNNPRIIDAPLHKNDAQKSPGVGDGDVWELLSPEGMASRPLLNAQDTLNSNGPHTRPLASDHVDPRSGPQIVPNTIGQHSAGPFMHAGDIANSWQKRVEDVERVVNWRKNDAQTVQQLESRVRELEPTLQDLHALVEHRISAVKRDQDERLDEKWGHYEHEDQRFKEIVRTESLAIQANYASLKASALDAQRSLQARSEDMATRIDKIDIRLASLQSTVEITEQKLLNVPFSGLVNPPETTAMEQHAAKLESRLKDETAYRLLLQQETQKEISQLHVRLQEQAKRSQEELARKLQAAASTFQAEMHQGDRVLQTGQDGWEAALGRLSNKIETTLESALGACSAVEQRVLERLTQAVSDQTRGSRELWGEHIKLNDEWRQSLESLEKIVDGKVLTMAEKMRVKNRQNEEDEQALKVGQKRLNEKVVARLDALEKAKAVDRQQTTTTIQQTRMHMDGMEDVLKRLDEGLQHWVQKSREDVAKIERMMEDETGKMRAWCDTKMESVGGALRKDIDGMSEDYGRASQKIEAVEERSTLALSTIIEDVAQMDGRVRSKLLDSNNHWQRGMQKIEFDCSSNVNARLLEHEEKIHATMARLESHYETFRGELVAKIGQIEKNVFDRMTGMDKKMTSQFQAHVAENTRKLHALGDAVGKKHAEMEGAYQDFRATLEEQYAVTKEALRHDIEDVYRKLALESAQVEKVTTEMARAIATHEEQTLEDLTLAHKKWSDHLKEQCEFTKLECDQNMTCRLDTEKAETTQRETERLQSMQKRLLAHEELMIRRYDNFKERTTEQLATAEHTISAHIVEAQADHARHKEATHASFATFKEENQVELSNYQEEITREQGRYEESMNERHNEQVEELAVEKQRIQSDVEEFKKQCDTQFNEFNDAVEEKAARTHEEYTLAMSDCREKLEEAKTQVEENIRTSAADHEAHEQRIAASITGFHDKVESRLSDMCSAQEQQVSKIAEMHDIQLEIEQQNALDTQVRLTAMKSRVDDQLRATAQTAKDDLEEAQRAWENDMGEQMVDLRTFTDGRTADIMDAVQILEEQLRNAPWTYDIGCAQKDQWVDVTCALTMESLLLRTEQAALCNIVDESRRKFAKEVDAGRKEAEQLARQVTETADAISKCTAEGDAGRKASEEMAQKVSNTEAMMQKFAEESESIQKASEEMAQKVAETEEMMQKFAEESESIQKTSEEMAQKVAETEEMMQKFAEESESIQKASEEMAQKVAETEEKVTDSATQLQARVTEFDTTVRAKFDAVDTTHRDIAVRFETKAFLQEEASLCADRMVNKFLLALSNKVELAEQRLQAIEGVIEDQNGSQSVTPSD